MKRSAWIAAFVITSTIFSFAQTATRSVIDERNVRAEMNFLASDAMQGRGSGTIFERVAAEYIGSQFMQFGLEPAGEPDAAGKPTYVQTVNIDRASFAGNPSLKYGTTTLEHGKEMLVLRTNAATASGDLQKITFGETPTAGAAVFVQLGERTSEELMQGLQGLMQSGAAIIMMQETEQLRANWAAMAGRKISFTTSAKPSVLVAVSKEAAAGVLGQANGTKIDFGGTLAAGEKKQTWNAMGKITGSDRTLSAEVILLTAHLDHLGVRDNAPGDDKIFNGADDDASGSIAVLELARVLGRSVIRPKRTVYFVCFGSEESGGAGATYFVNNMPFPKEKLVANLEFEMIGRPDDKVKPEELWLTGYERSNLGPELAKRGAKLVQDPHPQENFFQRSDNIQLARAGIIAHTVSSFGLHADYHHASDEIRTIDFVHMTRSINSMVTPVKWLVNSNFRPAWNAGMKP